MQITCAHCKTNYSLTDEQIRGLSYSILPCRQCSKYIKITTCPYCQSYYSITFTSTQKTRYSLTCERCAKSFTIEFPLIREPKPDAHDAPVTRAPAAPVRADEHNSPFNKTADTGTPTPPAEPKTGKAPWFSRLRADARPATRPLPQNDTPNPWTTGSAQKSASEFTLANLFAICGSAFSVPKMLAGSTGIVIAFMLINGYRWLINGLFETGGSAAGEYTRSLLNIIPLALVFFIYLLTAAVIARMTMVSMGSGKQQSGGGTLKFLGHSFMPVFLANIALFLGIDMVFILFGRIPVVGPVLFALLFLPIYAASLCVILILAIGFWFYPPVIAAHSGRGLSAVGSMFRFIKNQNFSLAYTIPLMTIITAVTFAAIYLLHYGSFTLSMYLSRHLLAEEGERIFSAVPQSLLSVSDITVAGSDAGVFRSLLDNLVLAHTIGGFIIGLVFSLISIVLFSSFVSITATLSAHMYVMMDRGTDMDDRSKLRILLLLVLILAGVFLTKKIFF